MHVVLGSLSGVALGGFCCSNTSVLLEIRQEYRDTKKQLEQYDRFIDRHRIVTLLIILVIGIVIVRAAISFEVLVQPAIIVFFIVIAAAIIALSRRFSSEKKLHKQMAQLKNEVVIFHKYSREGYKDITRDDLGLWSGAESTDSKPQQTGGVAALLFVLFLIVLVIIIMAFRPSETAPVSHSPRTSAPTYTPSPASTSTHCTSSAFGGSSYATVYTDCY